MAKKYKLLESQLEAYEKHRGDYNVAQIHGKIANQCKWATTYDLVKPYIKVNGSKITIEIPNYKTIKFRREIIPFGISRIYTPGWFFCTGFWSCGEFYLEDALLKAKIKQ